MAITFRQLQHFLALSEELHFGRAAAKLNISQPPLSASLRQLEDHLGCALMERSSKQVRLTEAGAVFAAQAARILGQLDHAQALASRAGRGAGGRLTVSFVPSMLFRRLPETLRGFEEGFPDVELALHEVNTAGQVEGLMQARFDVGFVHECSLPEALASRLIETERLVCALPRGHRLAGRSRISLDQLAGERALLFSREYAAAAHDRIAGLLAEAGVAAHAPWQIRTWFTIVALVAQGMGVALVPSALARTGYGDVAYVEVDGARAEQGILMCWRREAPSPAAREFVAHVRAHGLGRPLEGG